MMSTRIRLLQWLLVAVSLATAAPQLLAAPLGAAPSHLFDAGSYGPSADFGTGLGPTSVAIGDVNGDGRLDVVTVNFQSSATVSVLLGGGDGSFGAKTDDAAGYGSSSVALGDLNGDGKLDVVTADSGIYPSLGNFVSVLLGNGDGSFGPTHTYNVGTNPQCVAISDLNGDGKLDVVTENFIPPGHGGGVSYVAVLLGNGDGSLQSASTFTTGDAPHYVAIADVNGDGKPDLLTANPSPNSVSVLLGHGDGTFAPRTDFGTGRGPVSVAIADLNADGRPDLVTASSGFGTGNTVSVLLGNGDGTFGPRTDFGTGVNPYSVAITDADGDGKPDLVVANLGSNTVSLLLGDGSGGFGAKTDLGTGTAPASLALGDVNGDGQPDLVTANNGSNTVSVLLHTGGVVATLLARFEAEVQSDGIQLRWQFTEPTRVLSATLTRAADEAGPWLPLALAQHHTTDAIEALDQAAASGQTYYYRLTADLADGTQAVFGPISATALLAAKVSGLTGIAPNPASAYARIDFALARTEQVRVSIVDVSGREAATLADGKMSPGSYSLLWDGREGGTPRPAGVYFVRWVSAGTTMSRRFILVR